MADVTAAAVPKTEKKRKQATSDAVKKREEAKAKQVAAACETLYGSTYAAAADKVLQKTYVDTMVNIIQSMVCEHIQSMKASRLESKEDVFPDSEYNFEPGSHKKKKPQAAGLSTSLDAIISNEAADQTDVNGVDESPEDIEDDVLDAETDTTTAPQPADTKVDANGVEVPAKKVKKQLCQLSPAAKYALQCFVFEFIVDALKHSQTDAADVKTTVAKILLQPRAQTFIRQSFRITHHVYGTITRYEDVINSFPEKSYDISAALPEKTNSYVIKNKILCRYLRLLTRFLAESIWNSKITSVNVSDITSIIGMLEIGNSEYLRAHDMLPAEGAYISIGNHVSSRMEKAALLFVPPLTDQEKVERKKKRDEARLKKAADTAAADTAAPTAAAPAAPAVKSKPAPVQYNAEDTPAPTAVVPKKPAQRPAAPKVTA